VGKTARRRVRVCMWDGRRGGEGEGPYHPYSLVVQLTDGHQGHDLVPAEWRHGTGHVSSVGQVLSAGAGRDLSVDAKNFLSVTAGDNFVLIPLTNKKGKGLCSCAGDRATRQVW